MFPDAFFALRLHTQTIIAIIIRAAADSPMPSPTARALLYLSFTEYIWLEVNFFVDPFAVTVSITSPLLNFSMTFLVNSASSSVVLMVNLMMIEPQRKLTSEIWLGWIFSAFTSAFDTAVLNSFSLDFTVTQLSGNTNSYIMALADSGMLGVVVASGVDVWEEDADVAVEMEDDFLPEDMVAMV